MRTVLIDLDCSIMPLMIEYMTGEYREEPLNITCFTHLVLIRKLCDFFFKKRKKIGGTLDR